MPNFTVVIHFVQQRVVLPAAWPGKPMESYVFIEVGGSHMATNMEPVETATVALEIDIKMCRL